MFVVLEQREEKQSIVKQVKTKLEMDHGRFVQERLKVCLISEVHCKGARHLTPYNASMNPKICISPFGVLVE